MNRRRVFALGVSGLVALGLAVAAVEIHHVPAGPRPGRAFELATYSTSTPSTPAEEDNAA